MKATPRLARLTALLLALLALAAAAPPAPPKPSDAVPLRAGDDVRFDLSAFPSRYEGAGRSTCKGTVISAIGPEEALCERTWTFEVPAGSARMVYVFRPAKGGGERRVELPLVRERKPVEFKAPADGALHPPGPVTLPPEAADGAAKGAAERSCRSCRGTGFVLETFEVTRPPGPVDGTPSVNLRITSTVQPPQAGTAPK